jgi:hypothetical protein
MYCWYSLAPSSSVTRPNCSRPVSPSSSVFAASALLSLATSSLALPRLTRTALASDTSRVRKHSVRQT